MLPKTKRFATETSRLEAFSDGVLAVIITIMVLELHPPLEPTLAALNAALPTFLTYALSFIFIAIYWNNHHHMLRASSGIDGGAMWANLNLLFWLSLVPFTTAWLGRHPFDPTPTALYGLLLVCCAIAYYILQQVLCRVNGPDSDFARAAKDDRKGRLSVVIYVAALVLAYREPLIADCIYVAVAIIWIIPDRRFEGIINLTPPSP